MPVQLVTTRHTFKSGVGKDAWYFTVRHDYITDIVSVEEIRAPNALLASSLSIPEFVTMDINTAVDAVRAGTADTLSGGSTSGVSGFTVM